MSSVRFVFPKLRLTQLLKEPGGLAVADAIADAEKNLDTIRPTCRAELMGLLEEAETAVAAIGPGGEAAGVDEVYRCAVRAIGAGGICGVPSIDPALTSLCDLLDHMRTHGRFDREAIDVHVRSWRLLMNAGLPDAGCAAVLDGLRQVAARYAAA